jgi:CHAT domain-containing protein/Flp pilus assembly protein TadD
MHYVRSMVLAGLMVGLVGLAPVGSLPGNLPVAAEALPETEVEADLLLQHGLQQSQAGQFGAAIQSWQRKAEADQLLDEGIQQSQTSQFGTAIQSWQQALVIYREVKDRLGEGSALGNLGLSYYSLGNSSKAITYQEQHLAIAREINDQLGEGNALSNLGIVYDSLGNHAKAIGYYEQSLAITQKIENQLGEGIALRNLGSAYKSLGNYTKAIGYYEQSLAVTQKIENRLGEGIALGDLGSAYESLGNYAKAIEYYEQSLAIAHEVKDRKEEGNALSGLGTTYHSLGNYAKAVVYHQQSLAISHENKDRVGEGTSLGNLGLAYYFLGNYIKAIAYQEQSLAISREIKDRVGEGTSLGNLGLAYYSLGNYIKAIAYQEQHLEITREVKDRRREGGALGNLGNTYYALGNNAKGMAYKEQYLEIAREIKDRPGEAGALNNLGVGFFEVGQLAKAEANLRSAIFVWESLRTGLSDSDKVSLAETQAVSYRILQKVLVRQKRPDAALEVAEQGRARAFAELLASRLQNKSIAEIQAIAKAPNLETIRQIAKTQNATLVEYSIANKETLYAWVIKPSGEITFRATALDAKVPITQLVENGRRSLGVRGSYGSPTIIQNNLNQLHKLLIAPIAADLPKDPSQRIIFLPQGPLFLVPFAALQDDQGQYLIDQHTLSTAPSIQTLQLTHEKAKLAQTSGNKLIVGNPTMPILEREQLPDLPGARQEAIDIAKILNTRPLLGAQATKATVVKQMPTAAVIHLATHGLLGDVKGDVPGAIVFAASGQDNGLLTASEIFDLKLNADLVVLSACDTGRGAITGDGVIGLSRSLIAAGAPSIVVSLWAVNDSSTSVLMSEFYRNLKTNPDKAQALRQATLTTKKQFPNPRDWAAFTLIGESRRD